MEITTFLKKIPDLEGYTVGSLRTDGKRITGIVLIDKKGNKSYILRTTGEINIEDYW